MNAVIIYVGKSITNTPKLFSVKKTLLSRFTSVKIMGIVNSDVFIDDTKMFFFNSKFSVVKVLRVLIGIFRVLTYLRLSKTDFVYAVNPVGGVIASCARYLFGIHYFYESHEIFCGVNYKFFSGRWRILWYHVEKWIIRGSSAFFVTDQFRAKFIRRYYKLTKGNVDYLLNVPSNDLIDSYAFTLPDNDLYRFTFSYCGGLSPGRSLENIIRAFALIKDLSVGLYFVGDVTPIYRAELEEVIRVSGGSGRIYFTGKISNSSLRNAMAATDCTFALYENTCINNRMCSPNKIFDAINANTLLICTNSFLTRHVIDKHGFGTLLLDTQVNTIYETMCRALKMSRPSHQNNPWIWKNEEGKILRKLESCGFYDSACYGNYHND